METVRSRTYRTLYVQYRTGKVLYQVIEKLKLHLDNLRRLQSHLDYYLRDEQLIPLVHRPLINPWDNICRIHVHPTILPPTTLMEKSSPTRQDGRWSGVKHDKKVKYTRLSQLRVLLLCQHCTSSQTAKKRKGKDHQKKTTTTT